jgi:type II secretory pathway component PulF
MVVTAQLQAIIQCNAPLVQGLELAAWDAPRRKVQLVLQALHDNIASGMSLHEAMGLRKKFFPAYYVDLVKVGESTGCLPATLTHLQEHLKVEKKHSAAIWGWTGYFAIVLLVQLATFMVLALGVLPAFYDVLSEFAQTLPRFLQFVVTIGDAMGSDRARIPAIVGSLGLSIVLLLLLVSTLSAGAARRPWKRIGSKLPFLRTVIAKSDLGLVARVLERLLCAGVPLNEALRDSEDLDIARAQQDTLRYVKRRVEEGASLSEAVGEDRRFPESFRALVSLGESSGKLASGFGRIADLYEAQTLKTTRILVDTICPCGLLILGGVVLLFELSVFMFLTTLADAIAGYV